MNDSPPTPQSTRFTTLATLPLGTPFHRFTTSSIRAPPGPWATARGPPVDVNPGFVADDVDDVEDDDGAEFSSCACANGDDEAGLLLLLLLVDDTGEVIATIRSAFQQKKSE